MDSSNQQNGFFRGALIFILAIIAACILGVRELKPTADFPVETTFSIQKGEALTTIAHNLQSEHLIRSAFFFKGIMMLLGSDRKITDGDFYFDRPVSTVEVALRISGKNFGILQHRVVFPEGFTNKDIAARLKARFPDFDSVHFLELAKDKEGYLFPDTYGFSPNVSPEVVLDTMLGNFEVQTNKLQNDFAASRRSKEDVITMASIIEKEANGDEDASVIAGILWKRIDQGIPLQVDAPFYYLYGKKSSELTAKELGSTSPYNTYTHAGLPPGPIGNPGLKAISAALHPSASPYLYYLHDSYGVVHYARTFEEHKANKEKFLK